HEMRFGGSWFGSRRPVAPSRCPRSALRVAPTLAPATPRAVVRFGSRREDRLGGRAARAATRAGRRAGATTREPRAGGTRPDTGRDRRADAPREPTRVPAAAAIGARRSPWAAEEPRRALHRPGRVQGGQRPSWTSRGRRAAADRRGSPVELRTRE